MSKLKSSLSMRLVDLVWISSSIIAFCMAIYLLNWLNEQDKPYCVTYIASRTSSPSELCITYRDSTGFVTCYTKEENWSKQVCLPSYASAFLLVQSVYHNPIDQEDILDDYWTYESSNDVFAKITSGISSTGCKGKSFVKVDYLPPISQ